MLDADEVMLTPWIVLVVERIEFLDLLKDHPLHRIRERSHAGGHHDATAPESFPEGIVQGADFARLAFLSSLSVLRTLTSVALPAANHTPENETEAPLHSSAATGASRARPRPELHTARPAATGRDTTPAAATSALKRSLRCGLPRLGRQGEGRKPRPDVVRREPAARQARDQFGLRISRLHAPRSRSTTTPPAYSSLRGAEPSQWGLQSGGTCPRRRRPALSPEICGKHRLQRGWRPARLRDCRARNP